MQSMTIEEAIDQQRQYGSTAAQHQTTDSGEFIRKARAEADASLDASRARGPVDPATGLHPIDMSRISPGHVTEVAETLSSPIKRALSRAGAVFPIAAAHMVALEAALKEEIAVEFWNLRHQVHGEYEHLRDEVRSEFGLGDGAASTGTGTAGTFASGGIISGGSVAGAPGTVDNGGSQTSSATIEPAPPTSATSGTVDQGGTASTSGTTDSGTTSSTGSSGTLDSAGSVTSAGTVANAGSVENTGTAGA